MMSKAVQDLSSTSKRFLSALIFVLICTLLLYGTNVYQGAGRKLNYFPMYLQVKPTRITNQLARRCNMIWKKNATVILSAGRLNKWIKSDKFKLIACSVHKAGSTNIARIFYTIDHLSEIKNSNKISQSKARRYAAFQKRETLETFETKYRGYKKFMFVRNPLERLLSAYRAKLPHGMFNKNKDITFTEFLEKVLSKPEHCIDKHLVSFLRMCKPCSINYDFIGSVDKYEDDMRAILKSVDASKYVTLPERNQTGYSAAKSGDTLQMYLKDVPKSIVRRIYERYYWDYYLFEFPKPDF